MTHLSDDGIRRDALERTPDARAEVEATESYGCFSSVDFEKTIGEDVMTLRGAKVLAGVDIRGMALDTESGIVTELTSLRPLEKM